MAWENNQGSPVNGVLLHESSAKSIKITNHLDLPTLLPFAAQGGFTDLGVRDVYALSHREDVPFMLPNIKAGTIKEISGRNYTFSLPSLQENETKIVSIDEADVSKLGYGGQTFKITLSNGRLGGYGARLTPNPMLPYALEVVEHQRKGEHVQYTVIYRGNMQGEKSVPANALPVNGFMYKLNATRSAEFGQNYDSWEASGGTNRQFIAQITTTEFQTHYHMTDQACRFAGDTVINKDGKWALDNLERMVEFIGIKSPISSPAITTYVDYLKNGGNPGQGTDVIGFKFLTTLFDKISMGILEKQIVNAMVWDPGGITGSDGMDKGYIHPGVWHQMDYSGYKHTFSIPTFRKEIILAAIRDFRSGKTDPTEYGKEPVYKIRTGEAGVQLLNAAFADEFKAQASGLIVAETLGQYKGNYQVGVDVFTPWFKSITIAGQFKLIWDKDPSLDPTRGDDFINPLVNGYRLSSYAMIIEDANFSSSNILILRNKFNGGGGMRMEVVNSTRSHPLFQMTNGGIPVHAGSNLGSGFAAYFRATPDTALVWDPTKLLKLSPINPYTGIAIL